MGNEQSRQQMKEQGLDWETFSKRVEKEEKEQKELKEKEQAASGPVNVPSSTQGRRNKGPNIEPSGPPRDSPLAAPYRRRDSRTWVAHHHLSRPCLRT